MNELVEMLSQEEAGLISDRSLDDAPVDVQSFQLFLTCFLFVFILIFLYFVQLFSFKLNKISICNYTFYNNNNDYTIIFINNNKNNSTNNNNNNNNNNNENKYYYIKKR
jgi:hypothetical protein